jgi:NDP-sugar pyrophosphorylase family protein
VNAPTLRGGIIAAGHGSRLRASGLGPPKALVPVAGAPLIEWVIRNFVAVGITAPVIIVNDEGRACEAFLRSRFPTLDADVIVKTTGSSLESFGEVARRLRGGRALISTVDAWCPQSDFVDFVHRALRHPADVSVLGATALVADEAPLWVTVDGSGRVQTVGGSSGSLVTAGLYLLSDAALGASPPPLGRLREFLAWLVEEGYPVYAETMATVVDVDRACDVALVETLARADRQS